MGIYHYTYNITNTIDGRQYIGVRTSKVLPIDDSYMGSSDVLKEYLNEMGHDKFIKTVLAVWPTRELAVLHEIRLHKQYDVDHNPMYYNKAKQNSTAFDYTAYGKDHHTHIGRYVTPWGEYESLIAASKDAPVNVSNTSISSWCKEDLVITKKRAANSEYLTEEMLGRTTRELGFSFVSNGNSIPFKRKVRSGVINEYVTPWGVYNSKRSAADDAPSNVSGTSVSSWCKNGGVVTKYTLSKNDLFTVDDIGKTYEELGFSFRTVTAK